MGVGWRGAAIAGSEDEFDRSGGAGGLMIAALDEEHVAAGAVEERGEDFCRGVGAVVAEDPLVGYATSDLHPGFARDLAKNLVETGIFGDD
jgi:hypothetical protein